MEIEEIIIDSTVIEFFDDYIVESQNEIVKKTLDIAIFNAVQSIKDR